MSSIRVPHTSATQLDIWHAMKPYVPQNIIEYGQHDEPILDYEWYDSNVVVLLSKKSIAINQVSTASTRPYSNIVTTGLDFSALNQLAFVNDKLVPNAVNPDQYRDPDLFLQSLEKMAD